MKLVTVPEMIAIEKAADLAGHSYLKMMEQAGHSLAQIVHKEYGLTNPRTILALAGKGNNGGDALVSLAYLAEWGWKGSVLLIGREDDALVERLKNIEWPVYQWPDIGGPDLGAWIDSHAVVMDGVLGTGIRLPLRPPVNEFLRQVKNAWRRAAKLVAVDTPSGLDCDTGACAAETLYADLTVSMAAAKTGFYFFPAFEKLGDLRVGDIGLPAELPEWDQVQRRVIDDEIARGWLPDRSRNAHKGTFGTAWIVGGSRRYVGAVLLSGWGAFRIGAGLVATACPEPVYRIVAGQFPESIWLPLPEKDGGFDPAGTAVLLDNLDRAQAILIGPGVGLSEGSSRFLENVLTRKSELPRIVVDADALKLLSEMPNWPSLLPENAILTPHPGEMSVLTGFPVDVIQADRIGFAERFAAKWSHTVVLKGAFTVIAAPDGKTALVPISTPALARAGTGDVLAGMITGLLAQGMETFEAACLGTYLHAWAGLLAAEQVTDSAAVLASDVVESIGGSIGRLRGMGSIK